VNLLGRLIFCCVSKKEGKIEFWQSEPMVFARKAAHKFDKIFITKKIDKALRFWQIDFPEMRMGTGTFALKFNIQEERKKYKKLLEVKILKKKRCSYLKRIK
jgi:hypothetical protein